MSIRLVMDTIKFSNVQTLGETGAEQTRDLLDERLGREEGVVLLGELLDELLVLVQPERGRGM